MSSPLPPVRLVRRSVAFEGRVISGRYRVSEIIGTGGMGSVYAAIDIETGCEVALKALNASGFTSENLRRFRREADVATSVRHKGLCRVEHLGVDAGTPFLVMERLHGETLRRRLRESGPLAIADAISLTLQLLEALSAAHAAGLIHRDVKPGNVFITSPRDKPPVIKLIDFGLAKAVATGNVDDGNEITAVGAIPGTPFYLTPEQTAGSHDIDQRVDVWAAALTLFEALFGMRLYEGENLGNLAHAILFDALPDIHALRPNLPRGLQTVFADALAKDRHQRFRSTADFRSALIAVWARHAAERCMNATRARSELGMASDADLSDPDIPIHVEL